MALEKPGYAAASAFGFCTLLGTGGEGWRVLEIVGGGRALSEPTDLWYLPIAAGALMLGLVAGVVALRGKTSAERALEAIRNRSMVELQIGHPVEVPYPPPMQG